jgi:hypothetical protein
MKRCTIMLLFALLLPAQDRSVWQNLTQLQTGDRARLSIKGRDSVVGPFQSWTPEQVTVGATTAARAEVTKVERYRNGGWSRGKTALVGAVIGGGAGTAIGAGIAGCDHKSIGPCVTRGEGAAIVGGAGAVLGAIVGVLLPHHRTDLIYVAK